MKNDKQLQDFDRMLCCGGCPLTRRDFLAKGGAVAAGALGWLGAPQWLEAAAPASKMRIRVVYALHGEQQTVPDWPNKGFDFRPVMARFNQQLARRCRDMEFVASTAKNEEEAKKILAEDQTSGGVDGYLVFQMNCWNRVVQPLASSGKPVLYADFQYGGSGGFLVYTAAFLRQQAGNVGFVASSDLDDLIEAVKCFRLVKQGGSVADFVAATTEVRRRRTPKPSRLACKPDEVKTLPINECLRRLKECKILAVRGKETGPAGEILGIQVVHVPFAEINEAWKTADQDQARAIADRWARSARRIVGVDRPTLESSAAMYLGMRAVMQRHGANAITVNCLGGFYGGHLHAYPCLGFCELNDEGLVGGCECDVRSAATMVIGSVLTQGRPGYISDPVIDTAKRQIIYAHCVAPTKVFGPQGRRNAFEILTHSEDRQGASLRSVLPLGYMTTSVEFEASRKEVLLHRAKAVGNDPDDRACRTKLCAEPVGDLEKLFTMWDQWGWHRVTFYGDLKEPIQALAEAVGWKVVEEA